MAHPQIRTLAIASLLLAALVLAVPTLDNGFSLDDYNWLQRAEFRDSNLSFILEPEPGQLFNPVGRGFFLLLHTLAGTNPLPFRLAVLILHLLNIWLLYRIVERIFGRPEVALTAAFLFVVATSYHEVLFWIAALFHPLNTTLCLVALLALINYLREGLRGQLVVAVAAYAAALMTKAPAFPFLLVLLIALPLTNGKDRLARWRVLIPFAAFWLLATITNLALGLQHSYLLERGYYQSGLHVLNNAGRYLSWMVFPWQATADRIGAASLYQSIDGALQILVPIAAVAVVFLANARVRFFCILGFAALLPFLPFVFEPVSRYTYLPAAGFASVLAVGVLALGRRLGFSSNVRTAVATAGAAVLILLSLAETLILDNRYEYRERRMVSWVEDVERALPELPDPAVVRIANLPSLGIDRGMHLEAALRLAYDDPTLRLEVPRSTLPAREGQLFFDGARIRRASEGPRG